MPRRCWCWRRAAATTTMTRPAAGTDAPAATSGETTADDRRRLRHDDGRATGGGGEGRDLIIARDMDLTTLDPQRAYCDTCQIFLTAVYETLIGVDPTDLTVLVPRLATEWEANADNTEFTFTLNPDATFADGSPVTADDVKFSWERLAGLEGSASYLMAGVSVGRGARPRHRRRHVRGAELGVPQHRQRAVHGHQLSKAQAEANGATADAERRRRAVVPRELDRQRPVRARVLHRGRPARAGPQRQLLGDADAVPERHAEAGQGRHRPAPAAAAGRRRHRHADQQRRGRRARGRRGRDDRARRLLQLRVPRPQRRAPPAARTSTPEVREAIKLAIDYEGILDTTVGGNGKLQASPIPNGFEGSEDLPLPEQDVDRRPGAARRGRRRPSSRCRPPTRRVNVYGVDFDTMMAKVQQDLDGDRHRARARAARVRPVGRADHAATASR